MASWGYRSVSFLFIYFSCFLLDQLSALNGRGTHGEIEREREVDEGTKVVIEREEIEEKRSKERKGGMTRDEREERDEEKDKREDGGMSGDKKRGWRN